ncbi:MAG: cytochrome P450 [Aquabacterium sp.]|uniref:cytochrome P450 n=1 Tax=Aquabacterium sp. TaxID=1872578 RepID=UPI0025BF8529|nr:cytochrome P450 [Aquabacterium sp.]MBI5925326.1 cytochrome P450 [Aquabacterium sp.]
MSTTTSHAAPLRQWADLPGPKAWPIVGNALQIQLNQIHIDLEDWAKAYGPIFKARLGPAKVLVLRDHDLINTVMRDRPEGFRRPAKLDQLVREMGLHPGVFNAEGAVWYAQRRMVMSAFSPSHVRAYFPLLLSVSRRLQARWIKAASAHQPIDLQADLMRFTVDAIAGLAFGAETNTLESDEDIIQHHLDKIFPALFSRVNALVPYWRWFKRAKDRELAHSLTIVSQAIEDFIAQARQRMRDDPARVAQPTNLLEAMIAAADQPDSGVTDDDVAGNVMTMLLAGEDTTANTLAWAIYLLHRNPAVLQQAQQEARDVVGADLSMLTMDHMAQLPYLEAVCHETMRLKPVAPFRVVQALRDTVVADVAVPKDTMIWCVSRHDAMDATYFPDPERFAPERWLDADAAQASSAKRVSTPFGAGPRVCPGRYLALVEMKLALATLLSQFRIEAVDTPDGSEAAEVMSFTMTPVGLTLKLSPISP